MINAVDIFLAESFEKCLSKRLGEKTTSVLKNRLNQKGKSLSQVIRNDVGMLEDVLREMIGPQPSSSTIGNILQDVCNIAKPKKPILKKVMGFIKPSSDKHDSSESSFLKNHVIEINDENFSNRMFQAYADPQKKEILDMASEQLLTADSIVKSVGSIDNNQTYEKIDELIKEGLLVPSNHDSAYGMRDKDTKYYNIVKSIIPSFHKNKLKVSIVIIDELSSSELLEHLN